MEFIKYSSQTYQWVKDSDPECVRWRKESLPHDQRKWQLARFVSWLDMVEMTPPNPQTKDQGMTKEGARAAKRRTDRPATREGATQEETEEQVGQGKNVVNLVAQVTETEVGDIMSVMTRMGGALEALTSRMSTMEGQSQSSHAASQDSEGFIRVPVPED